MYITHYNNLVQENDELYISDVLQNMIVSDKRVFMNGLGGNQDTIVLGSPQEYGIEIARKALGAK
jgi:hypothetical protein